MDWFDMGATGAPGAGGLTPTQKKEELPMTEQRRKEYAAYASILHLLSLVDFRYAGYLFLVAFLSLR